ncbi:MAG: DUF6443 domain-containing protein [Reichenbachiella sp.]|uniref:DUF6443 domain-containing protein n=1 Tax=Reichenbachiella sp. TaxID=2184521 RepID=UPI003297AF77
MAKPATPGSISETNNCGNTVLTRPTPPPTQTYYWQTSNGGTVAGSSATTQTKYSGTGTVYLSARINSTGCWSTNSSSESYTVNSVPSTPSAPTVTNNCGSTTLTRSSPPSGVTWYWQSSSSGTSTSPADAASTKILTSGNVYYLRARSSTGCWSGSRTVNYTVNPVPLLANGTGASRCGSGSVTISATTGGYGNEIKWYSASSGGSLLHTGGSYSPTVSSTTTYYAASHSTTTGCTDTDRVAVTATVDAVPNLYSVTGGVHCSTAGTLTVGLNGSQSGMEYQLYFNAAPVLVEGTSTIVKVFGTGSAVNFTYDAEDVGTYEVYAVNGSCSTLMTGTAKIINPPTQYTITTTAYCANKSGALIIDDTNLDVKYQVKKDGVNEGSEITGTGSGMTLGNYDDPGVYTVVATYAGSNCSPVTMAGSITVETVVPMPNAPNVTDDECTKRIVTKNGTEPGAGVHGYPITWYWFGDDENNASPVLMSSDTIWQPDIYYVKAKGEMPSAITCWSAAVSIDANDLIPGPTPDIPIVDSISVSSACGPQPATTTQVLPAGQEYYWQGQSSTSKLETDSGNTSDLISASGNYYVRTKTTQGCWSEAVQFGTWSITLYPTVQTLKGGDELANDPVNYRKVHMDASEADVTYKIYKGGQDTGLSFDGTGGAARSAVLASDGSYTVVADRNTCTTNATDTIAIGNDLQMNKSTGRSFTVPVTDAGSLPTALGDVLTSTSYADGMGRPMQSIAMRVSPDQKDMVSFYEYDDLGRMAKQYLPYVGDTTGTLKTATKTTQASFYLVSGDQIANDSVPYTLTTYEASPMNRVKNQLGVGKAWHDADRKASATYATNVTADSVIIWQVVSDTLAKTGTYTTGQLYKTTGTDEENHQVITYTNKVGQTVLKQVESGATSWAETYNVYDYKGRLRYVLPPGGVEAYESSGQMTQSLLDTWAFQYKYDHRHRLIEKRVPGADWVYLVYDDRNRLVLTQDGNQRADTLWSFVKYDQLNRTILTGEKKISGTATAIRTTVGTSSVFYETFDAAGLMKYTNLSYPTGITADDIYSVSYYDNYDFTSKTFSLPSSVFTDTTDYRETPAQTTHALKGLTTGAKTKVLGTTTFLETVNFYDDKYRVVQSISENHKGGGDTTTVQYNFVGQVMKTHVKHNPQGIAGDTTTIEQAYTYDHVGRSLTTTHSIDGATPVTIASYTYNELGALENKTLAGGFEDIDYEYNIRGWITQMNNPNDSEDHLFEMEFKYETATNTQYNGNIGEVAWKNPYESTTSSFNYTYDEMNRLKTADYDNTGSSSRDYGLESISYDANSNIKTLKRKGDHDDTANQSFDDLVYSYSGNKLTKVTDNASMDTGFKDGANVATEYSYDANGNLTEDKNKGITAITYNHINQPTRVTYDSTKFITYTYAASGAKVSQMVVENGDSTVTDYLGGFLYQEDSLQIIAHSQGRIVAKRDASNNFEGYEYQYHLTDHLGNVRVTFKTEIDTDDYLATVETDSASLERPYFYNLDSTRYTHALANHTVSGDEVSRIGQDSLHLIGPAIALKVVPGDTIDMEVYAYYEGGTGYNNTVAVNTFITALAGAFGGTSGAGGESGSIFDGVNDALVGGAGGVGGSGNDAVPAAYLSYILFDQNYNEIQNGYHEISSSANLAQERLYLDDITVSEPGYLYIYTSMQSNVNQPVYFDDLKVTHTHSPVVQKDDYLPFGLSFNSYSRAAITQQNFKFNAGSELEAMTDWYSTPFRKYDPSLGRFHGVDALADLYTGVSPSQFAGNNPIKYNDPTGLTTAPGDPENGGDGGGPLIPTNRAAMYTHGYRGGTGGRGSLYSRTFGNFGLSAGYYQVKSMGRKALKSTTCTDCASVTTYDNNGNVASFDQTVNFTLGSGVAIARKMIQFITSGDYAQITSDGRLVVPWTNTSYASYKSNQSNGGAGPWETAIGMTVDWALGTGAENRVFRNDEIANSFRDSRVVNQAREYWYNEVNAGRKSITDGVTNFRGKEVWSGGNFGISGAIAAGSDPIEQFVGSFSPAITSDGTTLTYTLTNTSSFKSLAYGIGPDWLRSTFGPGGNMSQTYIFTEPIIFK